MRRSLIALLCVTAVALAAPSAASAGPPARPLPLTQAQLDQIVNLEAQPAHAAILNVHATYKSPRERSLESTRCSDDILTGAYQVGFPGVILAMLIIAAPL